MSRWLCWIFARKSKFYRRFCFYFFFLRFLFVLLNFDATNSTFILNERINVAIRSNISVILCASAVNTPVRLFCENIFTFKLNARAHTHTYNCNMCQSSWCKNQSTNLSLMFISFQRTNWKKETNNKKKHIHSHRIRSNIQIDL